MKKSNRRNFLIQSSIVGLGLTMSKNIYPKLTATNNVETPINFTQSPLSYSFNSLEPFIDATTMEIHYTKHAATYLKNLNEALQVANAQQVDLLIVLKNISKESIKIRNNAGGHFNHELFWRCMKSPNSNAVNLPTGDLLNAINTQFQSVDNFKTQFEDQGKKIFGSGWVWLIVNQDKKLEIVNSPNQDNPLMDIATIKGTPLFGVDVWEHAYYLKYQNKRADYLKNWWNLANWDYITVRFIDAIV